MHGQAHPVRRALSQYAILEDFALSEELPFFFFESVFFFFFFGSVFFFLGMSYSSRSMLTEIFG